MNEDSVLYTQATVKMMLMSAYKAGFTGPLELADEVTNSILTTGPDDSKVEFIEVPLDKSKFDYNAVQDEFKEIYYEG